MHSFPFITESSKEGRGSKDQPPFPLSWHDHDVQSRGLPPNPYGISTPPGPLYANINTPQAQNGKILTPPSYRPGLLQPPRGGPPRGPPPTVPIPERPPPSRVILNDSTRIKAIAPTEDQGGGTAKEGYERRHLQSGNSGLRSGNDGVS